MQRWTPCIFDKLFRTTLEKRHIPVHAAVQNESKWIISHHISESWIKDQRWQRRIMGSVLEAGKIKIPVGYARYTEVGLCLQAMVWVKPLFHLKTFNRIIFRCGHTCQSQTRTIITISGLKCNKRDDEARIAIVLQAMVDIETIILLGFFIGWVT